MLKEREIHKIIFLGQQGKNKEEIAKEMKIHINTVTEWIKRDKNNEPLKRKVGFGRKRKPKKEDKKLVDIIKNNSSCTTRDYNK